MVKVNREELVQVLGDLVVENLELRELARSIDQLSKDGNVTDINGPRESTRV